MAVFLTGGTGYIGSYVLAGLLERGAGPVYVLARDASPARLWKALQLHMDLDTFRGHLAQGLRPVEGDITLPRLGLPEGDHARIAGELTSVLHIAASLNRKSEKSCLNVNLRGTLEVIRLAQAARGLKRFSHVSTVAVAGHRQDETVQEDAAIDWERSDYDPYARTKKFCEHMVHQLLPDVRRTILRPSTVLGDSRRPQTTQFDMVHAFAFLAKLRVLPLHRDHRIDIVPVDYVAEAIARIHCDPAPTHAIYHLASGDASQTYGEITRALADGRGGRPPRFWPGLGGPFAATVRWLANRRGWASGRAASRLQVFWPYLTYNTVFDNRRVVEALGRKPEPFTGYCWPLLEWSQEHRFAYPYVEYPA